MKKKATFLKSPPEKDQDRLREPLAIYSPLTPSGKTKAVGPVPVKSMAAILDFSYRKFERIAKKVPFTQKEWASILHLSEKTLQRYAKDNKNFGGIYTERILQMKELIDTGLETFTSPEAFYRWLKRDKPVLGDLLTFDSLKTSHGIQLIIDQLGRIQHGVYI